MQQNDQGRIGIIGAMDEELATIKAAAEIARTEKAADMEFCLGTLGGREVVIVKSGIGKVNAGICAQLLISRFAVTRIINTGVGGAIDSRINIGDIVISTDAVQHDFDVTPIGFAKGEIPYTGLSAFPADETLRKNASEAVQHAVQGSRIYEGRICSGDQFIASREKKQAILDSFGGLCCEMEGAAIAQVCWLNHVPFVIIRAISDRADHSEEINYASFAALTARRSAAIVCAMIEHGA